MGVAIINSPTGQYQVKVFTQVLTVLVVLRNGVHMRIHVALKSLQLQYRFSNKNAKKAMP